MKKPKTLGRKTKTYSITIAPDLRQEMKRRALQEYRTVSSYICWLIATDTQKKP
jgi:hypothetical protein